MLVENLYGSGPGGTRGLIGDGRLTVREMHTERNPFFGGVNPEPIRPNVDEWLEEILAGAPTSASRSTATPTASGWRPRRASSSTSSGLRPPVLVPPRVRGLDRPGRLHRHDHEHGEAARRDLRHAGVRDRRRVQVRRAEDDRDERRDRRRSRAASASGCTFPSATASPRSFLLDLWLTKAKKASRSSPSSRRWPARRTTTGSTSASREGYEQVKADTLARLSTEAPTELAGSEVVERVELETHDGFKFYRDDGSWLLIRFSGTEALLRVYVEARSPEDVEALLAEGRRIAAAEQPRASSPADGRSRLLRLQEPGRGARWPRSADDGDDERPPLFEEAVTLDDPATLRRFDPEDMLGKVAEMPRQLAQARRWLSLRRTPGCATSTPSSCLPWAARRSAPSSSPRRRATAFASR